MNSLNEDEANASRIWEAAEAHITALGNLEENWDGEGASKVRPELIQSARDLAAQLRERGESPPADVYPLSEGTIIIEWRLPASVIVRIEIDGIGEGERMATYPDRPSEFSRLDWSPQSRTTSANSAWTMIASAATSNQHRLLNG